MDFQMLDLSSLLFWMLGFDSATSSSMAMLRKDYVNRSEIHLFHVYGRSVALIDSMLNK